jgi:hypothetical protein
MIAPGFHANPGAIALKTPSQPMGKDRLAMAKNPLQRSIWRRGHRSA